MLLAGPVQMQHLYVTKDLDCKDQISEQCSIQFVDKGVNFRIFVRDCCRQRSVGQRSRCARVRGHTDLRSDEMLHS